MLSPRRSSLRASWRSCGGIVGQSFQLLTAGMALEDVVQVECAAGCGHRLYSDRGPFECPCHWPAAKVAQEGKFGYLELVT